MSLLSYSEEQIFERLRFENPWWISAAIEPYYQKMKRRLYFDLFYPLAKENNVRRAAVLMGPRRVGKTVLLFHVIQKLLDDGVDPLKICFISIETPIYNTIGLEQLFQYARKATGKLDTEGWYIFFDEIQYLKNWEVHLKSLVDSYPGAKFIVSGSAAAALKIKSIESGAGRFTNFMLPPLTFAEYISLKDLERLILPAVLEWRGDIVNFFDTNNIQEINRHFVNYINYGGYPEVIFSEAIQSDPGRFIRSDIIDKVLLRDLPSLYGIRDVQELNSLFTVIAYNTGNEVSPNELFKNSGVSKIDVMRYLEYLEAAFLIKRVNRITDKQTKFKRASYFKIYLTNPSLRSALFSPLEATDDLMGKLVETAIFAQWILREDFTPYYARFANEGEVDLVSLNKRTMKPQFAVEIKWSNHHFERPQRELKSLLKFCRDNGLKEALVTTLDIHGRKEIEGIQLYFIPSALYAYSVGRKTLMAKIK